MSVSFREAAAPLDGPVVEDDRPSLRLRGFRTSKVSGPHPRKSPLFIPVKDKNEGLNLYILKFF